MASGVPQQGGADPAAGEFVQDIHAEERNPEVFPQPEPDKRSGNHSALQPHEVQPQPGIRGVTPIVQAGFGGR